jgi:pyruvate dehydrogenase (quinone)
LLGFVGLTVSRPDDVASVWQEALAARQPVVIDMQADPNVIALPPHTTLEQSKNFFEALAKGDPDRRAILRQVYHQMTL